MFFKRKRMQKLIERELEQIAKQEEKLSKAAMKSGQAVWKTALEAKIPDKVYASLQTAFCKGFALVFDKGRGIIEKSYDKEQMQADQDIRNYAFKVKGRKKELKQVYKSAKQSDFVNLAVTTVEGIGLGALGIGLPDIVLFLSTLLRGVYGAAINYGFDYESRSEQLFILKMLSASLSRGEDRQKLDQEVEQLMSMRRSHLSDECFNAQLQSTASCFALDMLLLKFVQGLPVVGIVGGSANPVYYSKIMKYVKLKYKKRYLLNLKAGIE